MTDIAVLAALHYACGAQFCDDPACATHSPYADRMEEIAMDLEEQRRQSELLPVADPQDASPAIPRPKRPSELPGAPVEAPTGRILSVAQAAASLGVSPQRVRQLIASGALRAHRSSSRLYSVRFADLRYVRIRPKGRPFGS